MRSRAAIRALLACKFRRAFSVTVGRKPSESRTTAVAELIAIKLVENSNAAPNDSRKLPVTKVMPTTANGGTRATAMETPGNALAIDE